MATRCCSPARKFGWTVAHAVRETHTFQGFAHAGGTFCAIDFGKSKRQLDIFLKRHAREQIKGLEDHADGVTTIARQFERGERGDILAVSRRWSRRWGDRGRR